MMKGVKKYLGKCFWSILNIINKITPKKPNIILLYSGVEYKDNIKAIGDYIYTNQIDQIYSVFYGEYQRTKKSIFINGKKIKVHNKLISALIFIFSGHVFYAFNTLPIEPSDKQIVIQMWHGTPLKRIFNYQKDIKVKYDYFTYILATSEFFAQFMSSAVPCEREKVIICGHPRNDMLFHEHKKPEFVENDKLIFWAPTFRKAKYWKQCDSNINTILPLFDLEQLDELNTELNKNNVKLMVKLHPMEDCPKNFYFKCTNLEVYSHNMFTDKGYELYSMLAISDALITDYSSVYFDYLLLDKPIGFVIEDFESYESKRGFIFKNPLDYMPGEIIKNQNQLYKFIENIAMDNDKYSVQRSKINDFANYYKDGLNCERVLSLSNVIKVKI